MVNGDVVSSSGEVIMDRGGVVIEGASVAVADLIVSCSVVGAGAVVVVVHVGHESAIVACHGDTIGPVLVLLEIASDVDLLESGKQVLGESVLSVGVALLELSHDGGHLVLHLGQELSGLGAVGGHSSEVVDGVGGVAEELHDRVVVDDGVRVEVLLTPLKVAQCQVEHAGDGVVHVHRVVGSLVVTEVAFEDAVVSVRWHAMGHRTVKSLGCVKHVRCVEV